MDRRRGKEIPKTLRINVVDLCEKLFYGQGSKFAREEKPALLFSHFGCTAAVLLNPNSRTGS
jgi:hypothetical protein